jgi:F-type H+-transporting ATPase subunit b
MQINWFTVIAQVINFLILVWLLKRFLYKPILSAIDEREKKITAQLRDADARTAEAKKEQEEFGKKNKDFDQQKAALMSKAMADANMEGQKLLEGMKKETDALRAGEQQAIAGMKDSLDREVAQRTQQEVFVIAKKALAELANIGLEEQQVNVFVKRVNELKEDGKTQFIDAFRQDSNPIIVQSAFEVAAKQQTEIEAAVNGILGVKRDFRFKTASGIISGIEVAANGYKLAWSLSEYISSLEKSVSEEMIVKN